MVTEQPTYLQLRSPEATAVRYRQAWHVHTYIATNVTDRATDTGYCAVSATRQTLVVASTGTQASPKKATK